MIRIWLFGSTGSGIATIFQPFRSDYCRSFALDDLWYARRGFNPLVREDANKKKLKKKNALAHTTVSLRGF